MNHPVLANKNECTGCLVCISSCNKNALSSYVDEEGHLAVRCNTEKCILCHNCEKVCPVVSHYDYSGKFESKFFAAWNLDSNIRKRSVSGGAFSAMALYVLEQGGYVFGAANVGVCDIKHICINNKKDLALLQGSKYTQSNAEISYLHAYKLLKEEKFVLFSGTGCQIAGLLSFLKHKVYSGRLITVDLICGGVPSKLLINKFFESEPYKIQKILSFRTKESGWKSAGFKYNMKTIDDNGCVHDYSNVKNFITDGFCSELTNRYSCYNCQYNGISRKADFTIGDLWGDNLYESEHYNGISLVIAHNQQSVNLLDQMSKFLYVGITDKENAIKYNHRIVNGICKKGQLFERKKMSKLFRVLSSKTLKHIYANDVKVFSFWMIYKLLTKIRIKLL